MKSLITSDIDMTSVTDEMRFVVLQGREFRNIFWSTLRPGTSPEEARLLDDGTLAYDVLWVGTSEEDAKKCWCEFHGLRSV